MNQNTLKLVDQAAVTPLKVNPFLFKIEKDGKSAILFGTRHAGISLSQMPDFVLNTLSQSDLVATEMGKQTTFLMFVVAVLMVFNLFRFRGPKLSQTLSPEAYRILENRFKKNDIPLKVLDFLTPTLAYLISNIDSLGKTLESGARLDDEIASWAVVRKVKVIALDNISQAMRAASCLVSDENLEKELLSVKDPEQEKIESLKHLDYFISGNLVDLNEALRKSELEMPVKFMRSTVERNQAWIPKIELALRKYKTPFFAFGCLHLVGPHGIISILEARGYKVTRITS